MYSTWRKLDMLIFMENLQWISEKISFPSTFQLRAICSLGICSWYNQLRDDYTMIFQWKVHLCLTCSGMKGPKTYCLSGKITVQWKIKTMPLASLTNSFGHFSATSPCRDAFRHRVFWWRCLCDVAHPFFYTPYCVVGSRKCISYIFILLQELESGLSISTRQFIPKIGGFAKTAIQLSYYVPETWLVSRDTLMTQVYVFCSQCTHRLIGP